MFSLFQVINSFPEIKKVTIPVVISSMSKIDDMVKHSTSILSNIDENTLTPTL